jgi:hypothetical protein
MALVVADRVWETTSTSGTGTLTLSGAVSGYQTFAVIGNGNTTYYTITNGTDWEVGIGTYTSSGTTLSRDTVLSSSSGGSKITVTPGSFVFVDYPASKAVYEDASDNVTGYSISGGTINGTTIGATTPSSVNATTITGQTGVLRGTGQNLLLFSEQFDNANWSKTNVTVSPNVTTAPDSTSTADSLIETVANSSHYVDSSLVSVVTGAQYVFSVYAKKGDGATAPDVFQITYTNGFAGTAYANFAISGASAGTVTATGATASITNVGSGWYRCSMIATATSSTNSELAVALINNNPAAGRAPSYTGLTTSNVFIWGAQFEIASTVGTYIPTTTTAVYGTPTLSFSGVSTIGLESNGSLFVQPAGTGAIQAQATTSTTAGGNARGQYAVDWQTSRNGAAQVASSTQSVVGGGFGNTASNVASTVAGGASNVVNQPYGGILSGQSNAVTLNYASVVGGSSNTGSGYYGFVGGGTSNSTTSSSAVTTQSATMNGTTAVTLSGSNANIKVGQFITGTSITFPNTYVAAISGTSLTLSQAASGSSTSTLSFFTPHGVVVGGGNNQATGSYSFIGGGGDAGTAANRNTASGAWSAVVSGRNNIASGAGSFIGSGGYYDGLGTANNGNTASGDVSVVNGGILNQATGFASTIIGGQGNSANNSFGAVLGTYGSGRSINGNIVLSANVSPLGTFVAGNSQSALLVLARQTTDATATALTSNTAAAGTGNQVILPNNSAYFFKGSCIANVTGAANGAAWSFEGAIMRGANAASTVLIDTPSVNRVAASSGATAWTIALTADTTNGGLTVTVTGVASTTIRWVAKVETTEVTF